MEFEYDLPLPQRTRDGRLRVIGWCVDTGKCAIRRARLRIGSWEIPAHTGISRADVVSYLNAPESLRPGIEFRFELPLGTHDLHFEVQTEPSPEWICVTSLSVVIEPPPLTPEELRTDPDKLVAFQLGIHAKHPPKPVSFPDLPHRPHNNYPRLSLVTPSYQQARFIGQTIKSVETNDLAGVEHVIMDGGSTDYTRELLQGQNYPHLRWFSEADQGQADAIQKGFAQTRGSDSDLMAWINSDDFYIPRALDFVRSFFHEHPEVDVVYANRIVVDEKGNEINRWFLPRHDPEVLKLNDYIPQETLFWRRQIWNEVGGLNPRWQFALDWDLLLRFQEAGARFHHLPEFLGLFRVHSAQKTSAQMAQIGQKEIDQLRRRTFGRDLTQEEITYHPALTAFLRDSYHSQRQAESAG